MMYWLLFLAATSLTAAVIVWAMLKASKVR